MARKPMPWFRVYVEITRDAKIRRLTPAHRWLWIAVLAFARRADRGGDLMITDDVPAAISDIADDAGMTPAATRKGLAAMVDLGLIDHDETQGIYTVRQFSERQFDSDRVTKRTRKHRSKAPPNTDDGTFHHRSGNVPGTAPESESESETELPTQVVSPTGLGTDPPDPTTDDDDEPKPDPTPMDLDQLATAVARARSTRLGGHHGPGWIRSVAAGLDRQALATAPTTDPAELDRHLDGLPLTDPPHPAIAASQAPDCDTCHGMRIVETDTGVRDCPDCCSKVHT